MIKTIKQYIVDSQKNHITNPQQKRDFYFKQTPHQIIILRESIEFSYKVEQAF